LTKCCAKGRFPTFATLIGGNPKIQWAVVDSPVKYRTWSELEKTLKDKRDGSGELKKKKI